MKHAAPEADISDEISRAALPLSSDDAAFEPLLDRIGDARVVLLGEATHGTHEFYAARRRITRLLVERKGFELVAVEADWPDAYRVNRYVRGQSDDADAATALGDFQRFPTWMWRNTDVVRLVEWLREHNESAPADRSVGFYGLDLYSLYASMQEVVRYLETIDPEAAGRARYRYSCFDHYGDDSQAYGYAASIGASSDCEDQVVDQLEELRTRAQELARRDGRLPEDEHFYAEQNARLVRNAEQYYRSMFRGRVQSWNLRDRHMAETLAALLRHFDGRTGRAGPSRAVVWEHNSHLGDARATQMGDLGEWNVGQLVREEHGDDAVLVGFTTHSGTVTAANDWDGAGLRRNVRPALDGSYEALFHEADPDDFMLLLDDPALREALPAEALERAIGVVYRPETERVSHYFSARLREQFDVVLHYDVTRALEPLERTAEWDRGEAPETWPSGL